MFCVKHLVFFKLSKKAFSLGLAVTLALQPIASVAQSLPNLPQPGQMLGLSSVYNPAMIEGITIDPTHPFKFDFIIDAGESSWDTTSFKGESEKLIRFFLSALTTPEDDLWVNLSPTEKDRIIADDLVKTEMGQAMLSQDYILKQITSSLIYPESELGKTFWNKVYAKAQAQFGTIDIPTDTFHKVWIMPDTAKLYTHENTVYVVESSLKVMLDLDYRQQTVDNRQDTTQEHKDTKTQIRHSAFNSPHAGDFQRSSESHGILNQVQDDKGLSNIYGLESEVSTNIMKKVILPVLQEEVNTGKHFAPLRQIYHALILAKWYKEHVKDALVNQVYSNQNKVLGVDLAESNAKEKIYQKYIQAYKQGVFNYIKEDRDPITNDLAPRKYFSGGLGFSAGAIKLDFVTAAQAVISPFLVAPENQKFRVTSLAVMPDVLEPEQTAALSSDSAMTSQEYENAFAERLARDLGIEADHEYVAEEFIVDYSSEARAIAAVLKPEDDDPMRVFTVRLEEGGDRIDYNTITEYQFDSASLERFSRTKEIKAGGFFIHTIPEFKRSRVVLITEDSRRVSWVLDKPKAPLSPDKHILRAVYRYLVKELYPQQAQNPGNIQAIRVGPQKRYGIVSLKGLDVPDDLGGVTDTDESTSYAPPRVLLIDLWSDTDLVEVKPLGLGSLSEGEIDDFTPFKTLRFSEATNGNQRIHASNGEIELVWNIDKKGKIKLESENSVTKRDGLNWFLTILNTLMFKFFSGDKAMKVVELSGERIVMKDPVYVEYLLNQKLFGGRLGPLLQRAINVPLTQDDFSKTGNVFSLRYRAVDANNFHGYFQIHFDFDDFKISVEAREEFASHKSAVLAALQDAFNPMLEDKDTYLSMTNSDVFFAHLHPDGNGKIRPDLLQRFLEERWEEVFPEAKVINQNITSTITHDISVDSMQLYVKGADTPVGIHINYRQGQINIVNRPEIIPPTPLFNLILEVFDVNRMRFDFIAQHLRPEVIKILGLKDLEPQVRFKFSRPEVTGHYPTNSLLRAGEYVMDVDVSWKGDGFDPESATNWGPTLATLMKKGINRIPDVPIAKSTHSNIAERKLGYQFKFKVVTADEAMSASSTAQEPPKWLKDGEQMHKAQKMKGSDYKVVLVEGPAADRSRLVILDKQENFVTSRVFSGDDKVSQVRTLKNAQLEIRIRSGSTKTLRVGKRGIVDAAMNNLSQENLVHGGIDFVHPDGAHRIDSNARKNLGGIDFDPNKISYTYENDQAIAVNYSLENFEHIRQNGVNGLKPLIIQIAPLPSVLPLLGLSPYSEEKAVRLSKYNF